MTKRTRAGGKPVRARRRKTARLKRRKARKAVSGLRALSDSQKTENLRLRRELHEASEQQTATSEVLKVVSSFTGDLEPVFATILENAVRICTAKFGNIYRWEDDALHLVTTHNTPPALAEYRRRSPVRPNPTTGSVEWWRPKR